jgi:hypothetical protein
VVSSALIGVSPGQFDPSVEKTEARNTATEPRPVLERRKASVSMDAPSGKMPQFLRASPSGAVDE